MKRDNNTVKEMLTVEEVYKLFNWDDVWEYKVSYLANRLAACTGIRLAELQGLHCDCVFDDHIFIKGIYNGFGYSDYKSSSSRRYVPLVSGMRQELDYLLKSNGSGYVFSDDGGKTPVSVSTIKRHFDKALDNIGIDREERKDRHLNFQSWRYFVTTALRRYSIAEIKIRSCTGSADITKYYSHFDKQDNLDVMEVQDKILSDIKSLIPAE